MRDAGLYGLGLQPAVGGGGHIHPHSQDSQGPPNVTGDFSGETEAQRIRVRFPSPQPLPHAASALFLEVRLTPHQKAPPILNSSFPSPVLHALPVTPYTTLSVTGA